MKHLFLSALLSCCLIGITSCDEEPTTPSTSGSGYGYGSGSGSDNKKTCTSCNGTGSLNTEDLPTFGITDQKWCKGCGTYVNYSHCHGCKTCFSCGGKGMR